MAIGDNINISNWYEQVYSPVHNGLSPKAALPFAYSDADYPAIPTYSEEGSEQRFFNSAASDGGDGLSWSTAWNDTRTALESIENSTDGATKLTCRGTLTIPDDGSGYHVTASTAGGHGTSSDPIILRADPDQGCIFDYTRTLYLRSIKYWLIYGFTCTQTGSSNTAISANVGGFTNVAANYVTIRNMEVTMTGTATGNVAAFQFTNGNDAGDQLVDYVGIFNCKITNADLGPNCMNIYLTKVPHYRVMNNELRAHPDATDVPRGFFFKHYSSNNGLSLGNKYFENNYLVNTYYSSADADAYVRNNVYTNTNTADVAMHLTTGSVGTGGQCNDNVFSNNTTHYGTGIPNGDEDRFSVYMSNLASFAQGNVITNNVFNRIKIFYYNTDDASTNTLNYNLYDPSTNEVVIRHLGVNYTLANWQPVDSQDSNSLSATPTFVGGDDPTTISGFSLTEGSTGYQAGSDGEDLGADVALVGAGW